MGGKHSHFSPGRSFRARARSLQVPKDVRRGLGQPWIPSSAQRPRDSVKLQTWVQEAVRPLSVLALTPGLLFADPDSAEPCQLALVPSEVAGWDSPATCPGGSVGWSVVLYTERLQVRFLVRFPWKATH